MGKNNPYGVWCSGNDEDFAFNWLGAPVSFKLIGQTVQGEVKETDGCYHTIKVMYLGEKHKTVIVEGQFTCFKRLS